MSNSIEDFRSDVEDLFYGLDRISRSLVIMYVVVFLLGFLLLSGNLFALLGLFGIIGGGYIGVRLIKTIGATRQATETVLGPEAERERGEVEVSETYGRALGTDGERITISATGKDLEDANRNLDLTRAMQKIWVRAGQMFVPGLIQFFFGADFSGMIWPPV